MKKIILTLVLSIGLLSLNAQKYITKTGLTEFKASVEAFEPVEAKNNSTTAVLNTENGEVAALCFMKAFRFKVALMEEHFNENYMESDVHPKGSFKGKIAGFDFSKLTAEEQEFDLTGTLTIREKTKDIDTKVYLKLEGDIIKVRTEFVVKPEDFDIEIPGIVKEKIAESIIITSAYELVKK